MLKKISIRLLPLLLIMLPFCSSDKTPLVGDVLDRFEQIAKQTTAQATRSADALTVRAANQLAIMVENLRIQFDERYNIAVRDLRKDEQEAFSHLETTNGLIQKGIFAVNRTQELLNLDVIDFTNRIALFSKKVPFYISSINGISILQYNENPVIEIVGLGFSYSDSKVQYKVDLRINNKPLPEKSYVHKSDKVLAIKVPLNYLKKYYKDFKSNFIPATFYVSKYTLTRGQIKKKETFSVNFDIIVLPKYGAKIAFDEVIPTSEPVDTLTHDLQFSVAASQTDAPNDWIQKWDAPTHSKILKVDWPRDPNTGANVGCIGSGCGFCYSTNGNDVSYFTNGNSVTVSRHCDGPACQITHRISYIVYGEKPQIVKHDSINVELGKLFHITLSKKNTTHQFTVTGKSYLGNPLYIDNYSSSKPQGPIELLGSGEWAGAFRLNLMVTE
jgi:hypothetical protein